MEEESATSGERPARAGFPLWLKGETGSVLAAYEKKKIDSILPHLFGYHIAQIGRYDGGVLASAKRIRNKIELQLDNDGIPSDGCALLAGAASLPFAAHSIDVVVMPHVLEYVADPSAALKEIERVLIEDGRLIITGFSPWSLWGLWRLHPAVRRQPPWNGHFYSMSKLRHWLAALGFEVLEVDRFLFRPPCRRRKFLHRLLFPAGLGKACWPLFGAAYLAVAQKRRTPVSPVKMGWGKRVLLSGTSAGAATNSLGRNLPGACRTSSLQGLEAGAPPWRRPTIPVRRTAVHEQTY